MTEKRFKLRNILDKNIQYEEISDNGEWITHGEIVNLLNSLSDENEQLKQDNDNLIHLLENQSMIIQELHSKLMYYQLKDPIVLTKEDLEIMGKAISYYSH
jgi:hypothetical protein